MIRPAPSSSTSIAFAKKKRRQLARLRRQRVHPGQRGRRHARVGVLGIHAQAAIRALDEEDLARERRTELRRHREPVLRVEGVIERSVKCQGPWPIGFRSGREMSRTEVAEWEEPRHPGPAVHEGFYPTSSHSATPLSSSAPLFLSSGRMSDRKWRVFQAIPGGGGWAGRAADGCTNGCTNRRCNGPCVCPGVALRLDSPFRRTDVGWARDRDFEGTRSMLRAAALTLTCAVAGVHRRRVRRSPSGSGGDADPGVARARPAPPLYAEAAVQPTGDRREDALAAAGKLLRTDDPAGKLRAGDRQGARRGGRRLHLGEGLRAVARRGRRRLGLQPRGRRARLRGDRRDQGRRGGQGRARAVQAGRRDHGPVHEALARRASTTRSTTRTRPIGVVGDFVVIGTEDALQAHRRHGRGRRQPRRRRPLQGRGRRPRRRQPRPLLRRRQAADRRRPPRRIPRRRSSSSRPRRSSRSTSSARSPARSRPTATACRSTPCSRASPRARSATSSRSGRAASPSCSASCPATRGPPSRRPRSASRPSRCSTPFAGALGGAAIAAQVQQATGLNLEQDVFSWIGDVGVFVRGDDRGRPRRRARDRVDRRRQGGGGVRQARRADRQAERRPRPSRSSSRAPRPRSRSRRRARRSR